MISTSDDGSGTQLKLHLKVCSLGAGELISCATPELPSGADVFMCVFSTFHHILYSKTYINIHILAALQPQSSATRQTQMLAQILIHHRSYNTNKQNTSPTTRRHIHHHQPP